MATQSISSDSIQLFPSDPQATDATSLAFRSDNVRNDFNQLSIWLKGDLNGGALTLQILKPQVKIGEDVEDDWTNASDLIVCPDEIQISYLNAWCRLKFSGSGGAATLEAYLRRNNN
jgi:hypothetical protein